MNTWLAINQTVTVLLITMMAFDLIFYRHKESPSLIAFFGGITAIFTLVSWPIFIIAKIWI